MHDRERGYALLATMGIVVIIGLVGLLVVLGVRKYGGNSGTPVSDAACTCKDTNDISNRIAEVGAAIGTYQQMILSQAASDAGPAGPSMFSMQRYDSGEASVQTAVNGAHTAGAKTGSGKTGSDCITRVNSASPCIEAGLQTHENVHAQSCKAAKATGTLGEFDDYKAKMTMAAYWQEEVQAYTAELQFLIGALNKANADKSCKPEPVAMREETYPPQEDKEAEKAALAAAFKRVATYVSGII